MRITPWQLLGAVVCLLLVYAVYEYWWKYQDQGEWVRGMNKNMWRDSKEEDPTEDTGKKSKDDNWL